LGPHPENLKFPAGYLQSLPKAELHLHLEGSVTPSVLQGLSKKYGTDYWALDEEELKAKLFQYEDFYGFLETYKIVCEHLREPVDYVKVLDGLGEYFTHENIRYAEIIYTPSIPWKYERDGRDILKALLERSLEIQSPRGTQIRWILDCVRQFEPELARRTAELAEEFQDQGVVGLGLGGDEKSEMQG
jgi:adenosine deaminase